MSLPSRLYAILDVEMARARGFAPLPLLDEWLDAGVRLVQLRAKTLTSGELLSLADAMTDGCRAAGATLIVNDRVDVAQMASADGVHVGQEDLPASTARRMLGERAWIGLSTHSDAQAHAAVGEPATYLAIGPVFATTTKSAASAVVGLDGVRSASAIAHAAGRPIVAIGGMTLPTVPAVLAAGADAVAVISDLLAENPRERARAYLEALG